MKIHRTHAGFSLIEVMIAVLILALGMLGIAALQATALRTSQSSYETSQAVLLSYQIIDAMRANRGNAVIGQYGLADFACSAPSPGNVVATDLSDWITALKQDLGDSACGRITPVGLSFVSGVEVQVRWDDTRAGGSETRIVSTRTRL